MPYKDKEQAKKYREKYFKGWYQNHKAEVIERRKKRQLQIRDWFRVYKSSLYCVDCGIHHPAVLCFHHRDPITKSFTIANVAGSANSIKQLLEEIEKCDVVCVNCHAKRHWRENHKTDSWEEILPEE